MSRSKTYQQFGIIVFSFFFLVFFHCGELWEENILLDHFQLKAISQHLASLLFLQSLILVSILLFL